MLLTALDLMFHSDDDRQVICCLVRKPDQTLVEIASETRLPEDRVEEIVAHLLREAKLTRHRKNDREVFSAHYSREQSGSPAKSKGNLLSLFDESPRP